MASYYDTNKATSANSRNFILKDTEEQHFPFEGLYIGSLSGGNMELPALIDICEVKAFCMLYNNEETRTRVNRVLEKLAWRIAITVPANLCEIVMYNGGNPGDSFNTHSRLNKYLVANREERVFFDGNIEEFSKIVDDAYASIAQRMSAINCAGKRTLAELNESLGRDARYKYQFFILTDFPRNVNMQTAQKLANIVEAGSKAGVYVMMSWDMNAEFTDEHQIVSTFNAQEMLQEMEVLFPKDGRYYFNNSGHDDVLNRFTLELDDAVLNPTEANTWAKYINRVVEVAKKNARPSALKQDFAQLESTPYEPVTSEISVTVGLDVNDKHRITFKLDSDHYTHGFVLGKSGSGKSALLNNIICSAIMKYSPEDLMLYLMDFKGVEFNTYRGLKHTKAVFVDANDPHMTLEVINELYEEYERRIKLFGKEGVKQIKSYNVKYPNHRLPQILFIADECQVMLKQTATSGLMYQTQKEIIEKLIKLARLGRAGGIHLLLATQQLEGVDEPEILGNLSECFLLLSAPSDSEKLVPDSSSLTSTQTAGLACYYHDKKLQSQFQSFFANEEETANVIAAAQRKALNSPGNGELYFDGSAEYWLKDKKELIEDNSLDCPIALVGQNIGMYSKTTTIPLSQDYNENVLIFGVNKKEQSAAVAMNTLASLIMSYQEKAIACNFIVIDCLVRQNAKYKALLAEWSAKGLCTLIPRKESGGVLHDLVNDISNNVGQPTILTIIGQERYIEMKRKLSLTGSSSVGNLWDNDDDYSFDSVPDLEIDESAVIPELTEEQKLQLQQMMEQDSTVEALQAEESKERSEEKSLADNMTYPKALSYILDEGPLQGVHTLLMVDKPGNILFEGDYDVNDTDKFRHKIILRSENKFLQPMRFSQEIDVETLGDEEERLRAYYYPEGDDPVLFTPYQMPDKETI